MSNNENNLSCDPANARRSQIPGSESVKLTTEDYAEVGDQASVSVNATGSVNSKRMVQQAFHPSLFITRPRSNSIGAIPTQATQNTASNITCNPPPWQRVPSNRNKKRKLSTSPQQEPVKTSNQFDVLTIDQTDDSNEPRISKPSKPPPIILYGVEDVSKLTELLQTYIKKDQFTYKIVNRNQLRISCTEVEIYKELISVVRDNGLIGHTFNRKDQRNYRVVIKNLHHTTPINAIIEAIESTGNTVVGEVINAKYGPEKKPTSTFFINMLPGPNNKTVKELKYIYHQSIVIEDPKKRKTIIQCQRCQQYGHSKNYCMRPFRCVKCGEAHKTSECTKRDRNTPATCALCFGPHPANFKGCEVYQEILKRKTARSRPIDHAPKLSNPTRNLEKQTSIIQKDVNSEIVPDATNSEPSDNVRKSGNVWLKMHTLQTNSQNTKKETTEVKPEDFNSMSIEKILTTQLVKFDQMLQQMSTLMQLISTLISKLN